MEMRFTSSFCADMLRLLRTPHSRSRLPNMRKPTSGRESGASRPATMQMISGKRILAVWDTPRGLYFMRIWRSFLVVTALMAMGWMMGTSAM